MYICVYSSKHTESLKREMCKSFMTPFRKRSRDRDEDGEEKRCRYTVIAETRVRQARAHGSKHMPASACHRRRCGCRLGSPALSWCFRPGQNGLKLGFRPTGPRKQLFTPTVLANVPALRYPDETYEPISRACVDPPRPEMLQGRHSQSHCRGDLHLRKSWFRV